MIKLLRKRNKEKEIMNQAKPCPGSQRIANYMQRTENIHNNLYEMGTQQKFNKNRKINADSEERKGEKSLLNKFWTFQPKISKMSKKIIANGKIEDRLLQDARKRISEKMAREEAKIRDIKSLSNPKHGAKTQNYAYKIFMKEYDEALLCMGKDKGDAFSFNELWEILSKLGFIIDKTITETPDNIISDVWIILGGKSQEFVNESSIFNILCIILSFNYPFLYCQEYMTPNNKHIQDINENEIDKNTVGLIGKDGVFYLRNEGEIQRLHSYFYDLTFNKINYVNNQTQIKKIKRDLNEEKKLDNKEDTFKPKINSILKSIEKNKNKTNSGNELRHKILINKGKEYITNNIN